MRNQILQSKNIFIDETPVKIQEKIVCKTGYMWTVVGGEGADPLYRVYDFRDSRSQDNVYDILQEYQGNLHSDKYAAYEKPGRKKMIN